MRAWNFSLKIPSKQLLNLGFLVKIVKTLHLLVFILLSMVSLSVMSANSTDNLMAIDSNSFSLSQISNDDSNNYSLNYNLSNNKIHLAAENDDWINAQTNRQEDNYSISTDQNLSFGNEISFAWNFSKFLKINLNVFENQFQDNSYTSIDSFSEYFGGALNKSTTQDISNEINRSITGYKFGISSELGLGNNYKLDLNLDYGQLEGADLVGFNSDEISTTSFALGIRKSKFGASVNTDIFLEENIDIMESSRLGFEIDWYFSDETKISLGSKQRMNNTTTDTNNSLDSLTGNVQYIKFQHNL